MKILLLGSGAKDHALAYYLSQSKRITGLFVAPGNPGTKSIATNIPDINIEDGKSVYNSCKDYDIDTVFVGTEAPLQTGVIDYLNKKGIPTFGTPKKAVKLDGDREFSRAFAEKYGIPLPKTEIFKDLSSLKDFLDNNKGKNFVIKKRAMSPSRIMITSNEKKKLLAFAETLLEEGSIILEESLEGVPVTLGALIDGKNYLKLPLSSEYHKTNAKEGSCPTGGMGAIAPSPTSKSMEDQINKKIVEPTLYGLLKEDLSYKGIITFSIILTKDGPVLVDYHVRFNDPAAQAVVPLIKSDPLDIFEAIQNQQLDKFKLEIKKETSVAVVIASEGYPSKPIINKSVRTINPIYRQATVYDNCYLFFGAVKENKDGKLVTSGGRNITVVGIGESIAEANKRAYEVIDTINIEDSWYRNDIGNRFFED